MSHLINTNQNPIVDSSKIHGLNQPGQAFGQPTTTVYSRTTYTTGNVGNTSNVGNTGNVDPLRGAGYGSQPGLNNANNFNNANNVDPLRGGYGTQPGLNNTNNLGNTGNVDPLRGAGYDAQSGLNTTNPNANRFANRGFITFRPIEGRFVKDKDWIGRMDPYLKFKLGFHSAKSSVAKSQGVNPTWGDSVPVKYKGQEYVKIKAKDSDTLKPDSRLGSARVPLNEVISQGRTEPQWIQLTKLGKVTGEVLVEMTFQPAI